MSYQAIFDATANAMCGIFPQAQEAILSAQRSMERPCVLFRPKLSIDGNQWCALYGENLQDGVAGFGDSPDQAMSDFDAHWYAKLEP